MVLPAVHKVILYSSVLDSDSLLQRKPKGGQWSQDEQEDRQGTWSSSRMKEMVPREGQSSPCHYSLLYRRLTVPLCRTLSMRWHKRRRLGEDLLVLEFPSLGAWASEHILTVSVLLLLKDAFGIFLVLHL